MRTRALFAPVILIVLGIVFLLSNLGMLPGGLAPLFAQWWPLILIAVGAMVLFRRLR